MKVKLFFGPMNGRVIEVANVMPEIVLRAKPRLEHYRLKFALLFPDHRKTYCRYGYMGHDPEENLPYYAYLGDEAE